MTNRGVNEIESPYDLIASEYDDLFGETNPYYQAVNCCERELFERWIRRSATSQFALDVGCGTGFHTEWLIDYGFQTTGIDNSHEMIRIASAKSNKVDKTVQFRVLDVNKLYRLPREAYAVTLCFGSTLNHLNDWETVARLISERLAPGGLFLFSYDNLDGIDVLARVLLRQFAGYSNAYVRDILFGRVKAKIRGESFSNHWRVHTKSGDIEVPLKYEHTRKWRIFLREANLRVCEMRGTHLFDCFNRSLLEASAGISSKRVQPQQCKLHNVLRTADHFLARGLYRIAAHIVGVAVKV